jgi:hypothetical protein
MLSPYDLIIRADLRVAASTTIFANGESIVAIFTGTPEMEERR